ncbi:MAG TPA: c-type cytochrome [Casimicrobiaceae bacterium]
MTRILRLAFVAATAVISAAAFGQEPAQSAAAKPDLAKAQQIASQVCAACHGADGNSAVAANPNLAGQGADYITLQLAHFKAGVRVNATMQAMVATLTDADMDALGLYFSQQKPKGLAAKNPAQVKSGQHLWRGGDEATGVPACAACHSPTGVGIPKNYPRLAGQYADYIYAQLKAFKSGERGADAGGKDVNGRIMGTIAQGMTDAQMKAVADYAAGLRSAAP